MSRWIDVLVVEDNDADVELMQVILEDEALPYRLHVAPDGEAALNFLRQGAPVPQLVILDFNMPRLSGLDVLRALREEGLHAPTVVMFTSSEAEQDRQGALDLGAAAYVVKPVSFDAFSQALMDILHRYASAVHQSGSRAPTS